MKKKQYAVFGLGIFGTSVARTLSKAGYEVLAVDQDMDCVERIADDVTKAVVADVTDRAELLQLGIDDFDVVIIAIGTHLEESILATMLVKELGVPFVVAKAKNHQAMQILQKIGADQIVRPEKQMGERLAKQLFRNSIVELNELDEDYSIVEFKVLDEWIGKSLQSLDLRAKHSINVLGYKNENSEKFMMDVDANYVIKHGDRFLMVARTKEVEKLDR